MNPTTHRRALAAAARLALATVALDACDKERSEPTPPAPQPDRHDGKGGSGTQVAATQRPAEAEPPADRPPPVDASVPADPIRNCEGIADEAFPKESDYPGEKRNVSAKVQECCAELLVHGGFAGRHRWDCCANLPEHPTQDAQDLSIACTPWGPPVPPAMRVRTEVA